MECPTCHKTFKNLNLHTTKAHIKYEIHIPSADGQRQDTVESGCNVGTVGISYIMEVENRPPLASKGDGEYTIVRDYTWSNGNVGWKHITFTVMTVGGKKKITEASYMLSKYDKETDCGYPVWSENMIIQLKDIKVIFH
tara:strand:+ start:107 stop:523 length:417 start_codon:yes stop_codon:yes gene_type:complete